MVLSNAIKTIIQAMEKYGVKRLIATATPSYKDEKDKFQFGFAFGVFMVKTFLGDTYKDIVELGKQIAQSRLDWTIVRLPMLSSSSSKGKLNIGYVGEGKVKLFSLTRVDLAEFIVSQIDDKIYLKKAPIISN